MKKQNYEQKAERIRELFIKMKKSEIGLNPCKQLLQSALASDAAYGLIKEFLKSRDGKKVLLASGARMLTTGRLWRWPIS